MYRTLFYVNIYESYKLLKTVRFFWPTLYMISWQFALFGLIEKVKWFSAQRKLICKGLTYLLHVNSFGLSPNSSD